MRVRFEYDDAMDTGPTNEKYDNKHPNAVTLRDKNDKTMFVSFTLHQCQTAIDGGITGAPFVMSCTAGLRTRGNPHEFQANFDRSYSAGIILAAGIMITPCKANFHVT